MDTKTKRLIFFIGSIFVAIIFLSSYAAFGNNASGTSSTSTVKPQQTFFSTGTSTAIVVNYSDIANITLRNGSNASNVNMTDILSRLQANGTIQNYIYSNGNYQVILYGISAYGLRQLLYGNPKLNGTVDIGATTYVTLPKTITLYYGGQQPINVYLNGRNYSVYMNNVEPEGSVINVSISALLTANGSIYNNQLRVSLSSTNIQNANPNGGKANPTTTSNSALNASTTIASNAIKANTANSTVRNSTANTTGSAS